MRRFSLVAELEPEQKTVLTQCTMPRGVNEFIVVQGVAGSGKTTIALHVLEELGEVAASQAVNDRMSLLLLTYNRRLAEYCANTLRDQPTFAKTQLVSETGTLSRGSLNVLSFHDLCGLVLTEPDKRLVLDDKDCIGEVGRIARNRGVRDLLPSQIFALITTFLRGRPELLDLEYEALDAQISAEMTRSAGYRMYGDSLRTVRRYVLQGYDGWKRDSLDRSDIAARLRSSLVRSEVCLHRLKDLTAKEIRTASWRKLGDRDDQISEAIEWLRKTMAGYQACSVIEPQANRYSQLLSGTSLNQSDLDQLRNDLLSWIRSYGLRGSPIWETLGERLSNPVIIVDELQDLSTIESEALISLWFQLKRKENSRLVLFGDLNQQMSPSGFEWDHILKLLRARAELYGYDHVGDYFSQGFSDDHRDTRHPFRLLDNNYRTTQQIACLAHQLVEQVARHSLEPEIAGRYLKHTIDPERTMPYNLAGKLADMSDADLLPRILIGDSQLFLDALREHVTQVGAPSDDSSPETEMLATVIITEHPDTIESFVQSEETGAAQSRVTYIPTLSCKGLEFDSCALFGISTKETDQLEADMLARWYTSFTRAKLKLMVYLSPEEFGYLGRAGWTDIPADVAVVQHVSDVSSVLKALKWIGTTELGEEEYKISGEIKLASFHRYHDERYIQECLRHFESGGWLSERADAAAEAAAYFETQGQYLKAADYYEIGERVVDLVRCLEIRSRALLEEGSASGEVATLRERANRAILRTPVDSHYVRAQCHLELQEWEKALQCAKQAEEVERALVGDRVLEAMRQQLRRGILTRPTELPRILENHGFFDHAAAGWAELGRWDRALSCAGKASAQTRDRTLRTAMDQASDRKLPTGVRRDLAEQLEVHRNWREAVTAWEVLEDHQAAIRCLINIPDLDAARSQLDRASAEERSSCLRLLADAHYRQSKTAWPDAFSFYHAAGMSEEAHTVLRRLESDHEYVLLTQCHKRIGDLDSARAVANLRQIQDGDSDAEIAAMCWSEIEDWEDAARCWMRAYYRDLETCETLLGPNPDDKTVHRATLNRCFGYLESKHEAYGISESSRKHLMGSASQNEEQARQAILSMIAIASRSEAWRRDLQESYSRLEASIRRSEIVPPAKMARLAVRHDDHQLTSAEIAQQWEACQARFVQFRHQAEGIALDLYNSGKDRVLALKILHNVCHNEREAKKLSEELRRTSDSERRRQWVRSWKILDLRDDQVLELLDSLDPISDSELILFAIDDYYGDDLKQRQAARTRYQERLSRLGTSRARQLLKETFGQGPERRPAKGKGTKSSRSRSSEIDDLLEALARRVSTLPIDEEDLADFRQEIDRIRQKPGEIARLPKRWAKAKRFLPDMVPEDRALVTRIEQQIEKLVSEQAVAPVTEPESSILVTSAESALVHETPETEPEISMLVAGAEPMLAQEAPGAEPDAGKAENAAAPVTQRPERARKPRHKDKEASAPGQYAQIDLHDMSVRDALSQVRAEMQRVTIDPSIRCLAVVHGYGKNQGSAAIRGEIRAYLRREWGKHDRVRKILQGELLDGLDEESQAVKEACPEISFDKLGRNNSGITLVLLN